MSDLISKQDVKDLINSRICVDTDADRKYVFELLDDLPSFEEPKWIPIREKLPEENGEYLITVEGKRMGKYIRYIKHVGFALNLYKVDKDYFADRKRVAGFYTYDGEFGYFEVLNAVAWMPLPEPYKMCGGDNE